MPQAKAPFPPPLQKMNNPNAGREADKGAVWLMTSLRSNLGSPCRPCEEVSVARNANCCLQAWVLKKSVRVGGFS